MVFTVSHCNHRQRGRAGFKFGILTSGDTTQMIVSGITVYDNETDAQNSEAEAHAGSNTSRLYKRTELED